MKVLPAYLIAVCLTAVCVRGQDAAPRTTERSRAGSQDAVVDYYDSMSDYFRQSQRAIMAINKKGVPDQEIPAVLLIARKSSASPNQIIDARKSGKQWADIAKQNNVTLSGSDFVKEANITFLSEYHGRPADQVRAMIDKGSTYIAANQELRRGGGKPPQR